MAEVIGRRQEGVNRLAGRQTFGRHGGAGVGRAHGQNGVDGRLVGRGAGGGRSGHGQAARRRRHLRRAGQGFRRLAR
ncbi:MAG: hypothetical protein WDN06_14640 [Asticcacaulis sp.]